MQKINNSVEFHLFSAQYIDYLSGQQNKEKHFKMMQKGVATSISEHNVNSDADCTMFCLSGPFSFIL